MPDPTACEHRTVFRVHVAGALLDIQLDNIRDCALLDMNSEGFAVATRARFAPGQRVQVIAQFQNTRYRGAAFVRNRRDLAHGRFRYGIQTAPGQAELRRGLRAIAIAAQRKLLSRISERRRLNAIGR
jgi:hypothetical protein